MGREAIIQFVSMLVVLLLVMWGVNHYQVLQAKAALADTRGEVMVNTSAGVADGVTATEVQAAINAAVASGRNGYNTSTAEDRRNEPETAARDARAVPDSRLRAFHQRRLARERRGCAGGEREGEQCQGVATER